MRETIGRIVMMCYGAIIAKIVKNKIKYINIAINFIPTKQTIYSDFKK